MDTLVIELTTNPLRYIEYFLAVMGAIGALLFFAGIGGGLPFLFTYSEDQHHMDHARTRAMWGLYLCMAALGLWELVRVVLGEVSASSTLVLVVILLSPAWIPWLKGLLFD